MMNRQRRPRLGRLARQGRIRSYRVGRFVRFDPADLDAYVISCARH